MKKALWMLATVTAMGLGTAAAATNGLKTIDSDPAPLKTQTVKPARHARPAATGVKKSKVRGKAKAPVRHRRPVAQKPVVQPSAPAAKNGQISRLERRSA